MVTNAAPLLHVQQLRLVLCQCPTSTFQDECSQAIVKFIARTACGLHQMQHCNAADPIMSGQFPP